MSPVWDPDLISDELLALTLALGEPARDLAILAEGNTSELLPDGRIAVKSSGTSMVTATRADFVVLDVEPLAELMRSATATQTDLTRALDAGEHDGVRRRASIDALLHVGARTFSPTAFVGHTHPTAVVGVLASVHAASAWDRHVYSDEAVVVGRPLYVPYATPGIDLGLVYLASLERYVGEHGELPTLVLLGNHGIVVHAPSPAGVEAASAMAVKGARVRAAACAMGGVAPLDAGSVEAFFAREDITERRSRLAGGS